MLGDIVFNGPQAVRYGEDEAILLRTMVHWLEVGRNDGSCYEKNGTIWLQLSITQMLADLPFLSNYKIRTALDHLVAEKLIITDEESCKIGLRKRKKIGYAFTDKGAELMKIYKVPADDCK